MAEIENQKILKITATKDKENISFITNDVVEVRRAKLIYYKWVCRFMMILATLSLLYGVCAVLAILKLAPELMLEPQVFTEVSDSKNLVKKELIEPKMESSERIMINFMKQYVELRNTFIKDEKEMNKRWMWGGIISYLSTYKVYSQFEKEYPKVQEELRATNTSRSVEILSVERTGGEKSGYWKVEFKTYDYTKDVVNMSNKAVEPKIVERYWTANIQSRNDHSRRVAYRRLMNPLGFIVVSYYQSEIEI